jgi:hypothetical protein
VPNAQRPISPTPTVVVQVGIEGTANWDARNAIDASTNRHAPLKSEERYCQRSGRVVPSPYHLLMRHDLRRALS